MSSERVKGTILAGALLILAGTGWAQRGPGWGMRGSNNPGTCQYLIDSLPVQSVDQTEATGLTYMREEEKLAHDVYTRLYEKWGSRAFANISQSEQRHFDAIKLLLDRYRLADPAADKPAGVFAAPSLQQMYSDLTKKGEVSLAEAFRVGATIEDIDIRDLEKALTATDNTDIKTVYQNLDRASRHHMRALVGQLGALGESYDAYYISASTLAEILAGTNEMGMGYGCGGYGHRGDGYCNGACLLDTAPAPGSGAGPRRSR